jgi:Capsule assembly protein Wzi
VPKVRRRGRLLPYLLVGVQSAALARGVSPYLPLDLAPEIEAQIERVLILGDQPVLRRPIPAAKVLEALPKACKADRQLCARVQRYLERFTHKYGLTHASVEGAVTSGSSNTTIPNRYGMREQATWDASAQGYYQPSDYLLASVGVVGYEGKTDFMGSMLSLGFEYAQVDFGYKPHWFSPLSDSSMLISSEAPTMPSVSLSNWEPISRFGLQYEIFIARMSTSDHILVDGKDVRGNPRVAGFHFAMEPASGWSLGLNRLLQYGGPGRPSSLTDLFKSFFNPSRYDNTNPNLTVDQQFGNEQAAVTSTLLFPGKVPFAFYTEYAGEDTSRGKSYLLGNSALSVGIHFPSLWRRFDLTLEASEWQNTWYTHFVYQDGMTNYGRVLGNWFGDQRQFNDGVGGRSQSVRLAWDATFGGLFELRARSLQNQEYSSVGYRHYDDFSLAYSRPWNGTLFGGQVETGHDVFGSRFTRVAGFVRFDEGWSRMGAAVDDSAVEDSDAQKNGELFIETGANSNRQNVDLTSATTRVTGPSRTGPHFAVGARRFVSDHSDLGARLEIDDVQGHSLIGVRALDYRYRFNNPLALSIFLGAARYALATPAYGFYYGAGIQWRNLLPGCDVGVDYRYANSIARDHLLPSDPQVPRPDSFYNISLFTASISYHF